MPKPMDMKPPTHPFPKDVYFFTKYSKFLNQVTEKNGEYVLPDHRYCISLFTNDRSGLEVFGAIFEERWKCPITENKWWPLLPIALFSNDYARYGFWDSLVQEHPFLHDMMRDIVRDKDYLSGMMEHRLANAFLGSGYSDGFLPYDGCGEIVPARVDFECGDSVIALVWRWYNR